MDKDELKKEPILSNNRNDMGDLTDEYFGEKGEKRFNKNLLVTFVVLLAVTSFGALGWYVYKANTRIKTVDELEVIKAENKETKKQPEEPGGMVVHDMDKSIYDNLSSSVDKQQKVERILPAPEEPITYEKDVTKKQSVHVDADKQELHEHVEVEEKITEVNQDDFNNEKVIREAGGKDSFDNQLKIVPKETSKSDLIKKEQEIKRKLSTQKKGNYIQVGSFKSEPDAIKTWKDYNKKYSNIIGTNGYYIEKKDLGSKGVFYRLQIGPVSSESQARLMCQKLISCNKQCILVKKGS
ncbi:MAG: SPOR domain-containing protein [Sphingobacteriia bacterium]|nr:SPOR domain-containing protein [Sphingobacteriia bacterium]